jgi:hypothetical protein
LDVKGGLIGQAVRTNRADEKAVLASVAAGSGNSLALEGVLADADGNGVVDAADYALLTTHLKGPFGYEQQPGWQVFNLDFDNDVDLRDVASFQNRFGQGR